MNHDIGHSMFTTKLRNAGTVVVVLLARELEVSAISAILIHE
jgi:hypothetical protein